MKKKAQGISINSIIIAAIALLVLVVLAVMFIGRMGIFSATADTCESNGGVCKADTVAACPLVERIPHLSDNCLKKDSTKPICCQLK